MTAQPFAGPIDQVAILVDDLDRSVANWIKRFGVGPWTVFRNVALDGECRGQPTHVTMDVALGYRDRLQIELICVTNDAPSPYRTPAGERIYGHHHVAWLVDDRDAAVAKMTQSGLRLVFQATNPVVRVAYMEDPAEAGVLFEVIEGQGQREMIEQGIAAARAWDGSNPVTEIDLGQVASASPESATDI